MPGPSGRRRLQRSNASRTWSIPIQAVVAGGWCSGNRSGARLRAVIALDDHKVGFGMGFAERDEADIFGRIITGDRGLIVLELDHHIAGARGALLGDMPAGTHQKLAAIFCKHRAVLRDILLVALGVAHIDARDPVSLCGHSGSPLFTVFTRALLRSPPEWIRQPASDRRPRRRDGQPRDNRYRWQSRG